MSKKTISLLIPDMPDVDALLPYLQCIDKACWNTKFNPLVQEFKQRLRTQLDCEFFFASVSRATNGLKLGLSALGLKGDTQVLIPALTSFVTASAVPRAGCCPLALHVDPRSWRLTPDIARAARGLPFHFQLDAMQRERIGTAIDRALA